MFKMVLVAILLTAVGAPASAGPNPQLVTLVENGLAKYGLHADVSEFATITVARLHLTMSSREREPHKRMRLKAILRNPRLKSSEDQ